MSAVKGILGKLSDFVEPCVFLVTVARMRPVEAMILLLVVAFGSSLLCHLKSVKSYRHRALSGAPATRVAGSSTLTTKRSM